VRCGVLLLLLLLLRKRQETTSYHQLSRYHQLSFIIYHLSS
jgi:hypothetical protein